MNFSQSEQEALAVFFQEKLNKPFTRQTTNENLAKFEQVVAYLDVIAAAVKKYSRKRTLRFIDSGAGNCYLSFIVAYYYTEIDPRPIEIHCIDHNERLMENCREMAQNLGLYNMCFHSCDIFAFDPGAKVDFVYSLHACDDATDKAIYLGIRFGANSIFSVSCCQHTMRKKMRRHPYTAVTKHQVFKERMTHIVGDSLRAILLEMQGYKVQIFEFVSSRSTEKNVMIRAQISNVRNLEVLRQEYQSLQETFHVEPALQEYLLQTG